MSPSPGAAIGSTLVIGSRASRLARAQAEEVGARLQAVLPEVRIEYRVLSTEGDREADRPLPEIGGKGVFTADLARALETGSLDLAVHSLKDLPTEEDPGTTIVAIPAREDPADVLVLRGGLGGASVLRDGLPPGTTVGTSSLRRGAQLRDRFSGAVVRPLRGNVETRLARVDAAELDGVVVAAAGLRRLGLRPEGEIRLPLDEWLPAPGQGALAVQARRGDARAPVLGAVLDDAATRTAVTAERALLAALGGGCHAPVAALATVESGRLRLDGAVYAADGSMRPISGTEAGHADDAHEIGARLAARLLGAGAGPLIASRE